MEVLIRFLRRKEGKREACFRFRRALALVLGRPDSSGSESSLRT